MLKELECDFMEQRREVIKRDLEGYKTNIELYKELGFDMEGVREVYDEILYILEKLNEIDEIKQTDRGVCLLFETGGKYQIKNIHIRDIVRASSDVEYSELYKIRNLEKLRNMVAEEENSIEQIYYLADGCKYIAFDDVKKSIVFIGNNSEQHEVVNERVYLICDKLRNNTGTLEKTER